MDQLLQMIQSADPTDNQSDSVELLQLEGQQSGGRRAVGVFGGKLQKKPACCSFFFQVLVIRWDLSLTRSWRT